jgi:hypothetical protein
MFVANPMVLVCLLSQESFVHTISMKAHVNHSFGVAVKSLLGSTGAVLFALRRITDGLSSSLRARATATGPQTSPSSPV